MFYLNYNNWLMKNMILILFFAFILFSCTDNCKEELKNYKKEHILSDLQLYRADTYRNFENIDCYDSVFKVVLFDKSLENFPLEIFKCKNLNTLELTKNYFSDLPQEIAYFNSLQSLYIRENNFQKIPQGVTKLPNLKRLSIGANPIKNFSGLDSLQWSLEELKIDEANITQLSDEVYRLKKLKILSVTKNKIDTISSQISNLNNLTKLDLSFNDLSYLPEDIFELKKLQKLLLEGNNFTEEQIKKYRKKLPNTKISF